MDPQRASAELAWRATKQARSATGKGGCCGRISPPGQLAVLGTSSSVIPTLVQRRVRAGPTAERDPAQKRIQAVVGIGMSAMLLQSALDFHFEWSAVHWPVVVTSNLLIAIGYLFVFMVLRENSFASSNGTCNTRCRTLAASLRFSIFA
jgi:protein-S-isoprenylcysteine O-methyltransferase Ste14